MTSQCRKPESLSSTCLPWHTCAHVNMHADLGFWPPRVWVADSSLAPSSSNFRICSAKLRLDIIHWKYYVFFKSMKHCDKHIVMYVGWLLRDSDPSTKRKNIFKHCCTPDCFCVYQRVNLLAGIRCTRMPIFTAVQNEGRENLSQPPLTAANHAG